MPKKTRFEKKQADVRRLVGSPTSRAFTPSKELSVRTRTNTVFVASESQLEDRSALISDLKKTCIIAACLFTLEIVIFYAKLMNISFKLPLQ